MAAFLAFGQTANAAELSSTEAESARLFDAEIAPLLASRCFECHDTATKKGRLDLSKKASAMGERDGERAIIPGNAAESLLWQVVESNEMPDERPPLTDQEKELLRKWIDSGAVWTAEAIDPLAFTRDERAAYSYIRRLTLPEYINTVRAAVGIDIEKEARRLLPPDVRADGFYNTAYNLTADLHHVEAFSTLATIIAERVDAAAFARRFTQCTELSDDCMRELIATMGKWVLRGPLQPAEIESFLDVTHAVAEEGGDFKEAARYVLEAMLQSPRFIYRIENQEGGGRRRPVSPYELASRLSYALWGAPPDKELMRLAESGKLAEPAVIEAQAARMLKDPRAIERSKRFIYEWLNLARLEALQPDPARFPGWTDVLAEDMREETLAFFEEVAWNEQRPLSDLMNAEVTFATPRLAEFYGLTEDDPSENPRVTKDLEVLYTFEERGGSIIRDLSGGGEPVHLEIEAPEAVKWGNGHLLLDSSVLIASKTAPKHLIEAVKESEAITIEAWIRPLDVDQGGPARIVSLSAGTGERNFTLGQEEDKYDIRFRTEETSGNGTPSLAGPEDSAKPRLTHVVYTRDAKGKARLYIDGDEEESKDVKGGLSNWSEEYRLVIGNETSQDRPWKGAFHLAAIYSRALSPEEIRQNFEAGANSERRPSLAGAALGEEGLASLQVLYRFDEGKGEAIRDASGGKEPLNLKIENPSAVQWKKNGLAIREPALIRHTGSAKRLARRIKKTGEITLEAWITPANTSQAGPARIFTFSSGTGERNFTIGQDKNKIEVRFRTETTDANGIPALSSAAGSLGTRLTHIVYTRDSKSRARLYLDGGMVEERIIPGDISNWKEDYTLAIGNETTKDRPWEGTFHLLAVYDRALTPEEVRATGQAFKRYDLAEIPSRGGLLTQGSLLTVGGEEASTVARGLFILRDFLYSAVGNPPPCADTTPVPSKPGLTQRAIAEARIANKSCGSCHSRFEPLSFALEKYNGLGAFREFDEFGNKLREDGEIIFPGQSEPVAFETAEEFMDLLAASPRVEKNITRKAIQFAIGRPLVESDAPQINRIHEEAREGGGTYASLMTAIATSDLFRMIQTENRMEEGETK